MTKVRFGVLGVAKIATVKVIPAMQRGSSCEVAGIASRSRDKAEEAAARLGIAKAYGSYEELLADEAIDAVYNPLPNYLHVPWSIRALEAGKHVLCEKPIALSVAEAETLVEAGRRHPRLKLMEAFMYRHHPQWVAAKRLVDEGGIGELRSISSLFSYFNRNADDIRNQGAYGGGGLMDIGCYPISLSRFLFGVEPERVVGRLEHDPDFHVDRLASAILDFGTGTSTFTCGTQLVPFQRVHIQGTDGQVEIEIPFNAPPDRPCRIRHVKRCQEPTSSSAKPESAGTKGPATIARKDVRPPTEMEEIVLETADQYTIQGDLFARAVLDDTPVPTPIEDAVDNMRVLEAIIRSAANERWERP